MRAVIANPFAVACKMLLYRVSALASRPESLDRTPAVVTLDGETLLARFDGIRQFARGGRRAPHKPWLLLYALARLKHDRQTEIRFNATEAIVNSLLRSYGPWGSGAHVSYPYGRLVNDGLWLLPDRAHLLEPLGEPDQEVPPARGVVIDLADRRRIAVPLADLQTRHQTLILCGERLECLGPGG
jgi:hypothetical protein